MLKTFSSETTEPAETGDDVQWVRLEGGEGDGLQDHQVQELHQNEQEDQDKGKNNRFDKNVHNKVALLNALYVYYVLYDQNTFQRTKPAKCQLLQLLIMFWNKPFMVPKWMTQMQGTLYEYFNPK